MSDSGVVTRPKAPHWAWIRHVTVVERLDELAEQQPQGICARMGAYSRTYAQM